LLELRATRPSLYGLEMHLVAMHKAIAAFKPRTVILDPISSFMSAGTAHQIKAMLVRLFDWLKTQQITGLVTCLTTPLNREETEVGISSLIDTWIEVRDLEIAGERNRALYMLKSRGMRHSNQVRELVISDTGVSLADVFYGSDGVLIGSAKAAESRKRARDERASRDDAARNERLLELKKNTVEAQIAALHAELAAEEEEVRRRLRSAQDSAEAARQDRDSMSQLRTDAGRPASAHGGRA
ncbi:MAG TPA: ATPase domain-containing protein, partial [Polyangiaceae bacterium]